jgi:hypothetical protein
MPDIETEIFLQYLIYTIIMSDRENQLITLKRYIISIRCSGLISVIINL